MNKAVEEGRGVMYGSNHGQWDRQDKGLSEGQAEDVQARASGHNQGGNLTWAGTSRRAVLWSTCYIFLVMYPCFLVTWLLPNPSSPSHANLVPSTQPSASVYLRDSAKILLSRNMPRGNEGKAWG